MLLQLFELLLQGKVQGHQLSLMVRLLETRDRYVANALVGKDPTSSAAVDLLVAKVRSAVDCGPNDDPHRFFDVVCSSLL
jgi:hypothetical protein